MKNQDYSTVSKHKSIKKKIGIRDQYEAGPTVSEHDYIWKKRPRRVNQYKTSKTVSDGTYMKRKKKQKKQISTRLAKPSKSAQA